MVQVRIFSVQHSDAEGEINRWLKEMSDGIEIVWVSQTLNPAGEHGYDLIVSIFYKKK